MHLAIGAFSVSADARFRRGSIPDGRSRTNEPRNSESIVLRRKCTAPGMVVLAMWGRVLIAETSETVAEAIAARLAKTGVEVRTCRCAPEALRVLSEWQFDVAVLDAHLPENGAAEVCRRIRTTTDACGLLVWASTENEVDAVVCYDAGADEYFSKALSAVVVEAKVRRAIRRVRTQRQPEKTRESGIRDLRARVRVEVPGVELRNLTRLEERLLNILAAARGETVQSDAIVAELWGNAVELRALYEHVSTLRAKLLPHGWTIVNIRGCGYQLAQLDAPMVFARRR